MPKIPIAVVSTSSDDTDGPEGDLATDFREANWTVVNMASIESFPFSEVSHQPYGTESTFLDSVSHGSTNLRTGNSTSGPQDFNSPSLRVSPQSPRSLFAQGALNVTHPRGNADAGSNHASATVSPRSKNNPSSPGVQAAPLAAGLRTAKHCGDVSVNTAALPGAPPMSRQGRKAKPMPRRIRSLQVGAPRWRDSDGDMELLVQREVSKNGPVSPATKEDYAMPSLNSSCSSGVQIPPPLWVESPSKKGGGKAKTAGQSTSAPTADAPKSEAAVTVTTSDPALTPSTNSKSPKETSDHTTNTARMPLQNRRAFSTTNKGGGSAASHSLLRDAQRRPLAAHAAAAGESVVTTCASAPLQPSPAHSLSHSPSSSFAPSLSSTAKGAGCTSNTRANVARLAKVQPASPSKKDHRKSGIDSATTTTATTDAATAASLSTPVKWGNGSGEDKSLAPTAGDGGLASRISPTRHTKPLRLMDHSGGSKRSGVGGSEGGDDARSAKPFSGPSNGGVPVLPPVSPLSPSLSAADNAKATTQGVAVVVVGDSPPSLRHEQRRRSGQQRRFSPQSSNTDTTETVASSVETVVVKPNGRHHTLKPLVMSPDGAVSVRLPPEESSKSSDNVRHSLPVLSPRQLSCATDTSAETPLRRKSRRAQTMMPSVEATPQRRASHPALSPDFLHSITTPDTKPSSMHTTLTLLADSPPSLRPQTRAFTEKTEPASGASSRAASLVSPASRTTAEKLVSFVRAVSDPEVLHVIHDYLVEQQRTTPRYRLATKACEELLERKEELLKVQVPEATTPTTMTLNDDGTRRGSVFSHSTEGEPFTLDVPPQAEAKETSRAAELQRLLAEITADQEAKEQEEDPDVDEFDDFNFFDTPYPAPGHFSFGQPTVSGVVSRVFAEGMLFKIKTAKGDYFFYNDTVQDVMMVRVQCVLQGNEVINERAMLAPVDGSKETEITIAVLPEETNFFMSGVSHLPHFMAKRVPVPPDYVSPSVTQALRKINGEINTVRKALGKWSRASDQSAFLKCCLKNHLKFTDLTFRPCAESLFRPDCDAVSIPPVTWHRPEEYVYLPEVAQVRLFRGEISCFLVKQGELNNHTVVAAMAAVAQFPDHVRWMFRHPVSAHVGKMERAVGCYRVTLLHNGWWKTYIIDDYVPASMRGPLFASCAEDPRRLWVPLLEKAYAKCLGSYAATCVVDAMEAMGDFTGFPVRYLDSLWAAAKTKPTESPSRNLFNYVNRAVRAGCTVLLFTPAETDAEAGNTVNPATRRSARLLPMRGTIPQFLPGHIYFLRDVAFYEELDLRMAQLKNPWTWETRNKAPREKKWKYTTWYDRPDVSVSAMGSAVGSLSGLSSAPSQHPSAATAAGTIVKLMSAEERQANDRKGTMWVEWGEVLSAFAGGGVCYTLWSHHRYRAKNAFVNGRPRFVLEMMARRKVDVFITLSLETVSETLDGYGTVVASHPTPLYGTALSVVQRLSKQSARVVCESCEDVECFAAQRTYVVSKDVSMKLTIDPCVAEGTVLVVPLLDPQAVEDMAAKATTGGGGGGGATAGSTASLSVTHAPNLPEVHFVLSVVSEAVAGDGEDLSISFVSIRRSCGVFTDAAATFNLESTSRVTSSYQIVTEKGVRTLEGNRISDVEPTLRPC